jgi:hypothetical protein
MNNMAVASRSSPTDARVPCSLCGGLVHPIAGRCKHCKADLASARSARPQAASSLPALARSGNAALPPVAAPAVPVIESPIHAQITQIGGTTPVALQSTAPSIVIEPAPVAAREAYNPMPDGRPILPPRPTGRMRARGADERSWLARNWPVFVIILASIAIILAVVLMVWPKGAPGDIGTKNNAGGPAPERMETNPLPQPNTDPWQNGQPPSAQPAPTPSPPPDIDDQTMIDPNDPLKDPFSSPRGGLGGAPKDQIAFTLLGNIANRLCDKAKTCSDPTVATMCSSIAAFPTGPIPSSCPQAKRCMEIIDQIDVCDGSLNSSIGGPNFPQLMMKTSDCMDALTRC